MPLIEVLAAMERAGVKLDSKRLAEIGRGMAERIAELEREIFELAGHEFTIGSPQQLGVVLFEELELSRKRRGKTGFSTDARVLAQIRDEHEIIAKVESWRELTKLKNTYLDALPGLIDRETGRIHTTFNQVATTTGRLSSTNPNLQNIPIRSEIGRPVRACFVAERGMRLLSADYNQVELRVLAHVAGEDVLREIFASGEDVHAATAAEVFSIAPSEVGFAERSKAKMVNFGIAYGLSAFGLADRLQISREEAAVYIQRYFERFPAVKRFIDETIASAERDGFVTTLMGRRRAIPELRSEQRQRRSLGERLAVNTVIQGTAADIIKLAMVRCHAALAEAGMGSRLVLQIHDELLFEGPAAEMEPPPSSSGARCAPPSTSTRRWRSTSGSARTGWRRSSGAARGPPHAFTVSPDRCSPSRCSRTRRLQARCCRIRCSRSRCFPSRCPHVHSGRHPGPRARPCPPSRCPVRAHPRPRQSPRARRLRRPRSGRPRPSASSSSPGPELSPVPSESPEP